MSVVVDDELESVGAVVEVTAVEVVGSAVVEGITVSSGAKVFTTSVSSVIPDAERLVVSPAQAAKRTPQATEITRTRAAVCARFFTFAFITRDVRPASQHRGQQGAAVFAASLANRDPPEGHVSSLASAKPSAETQRTGHGLLMTCVTYGRDRYGPGTAKTSTSHIS
ncbi:hypothetical protein MCETE7_02069 [Acidimicrobiia bacterium]